MNHLGAEIRGEGSEEKTERTEKASVMLLFLLIPAIGLGTFYVYLSGLEPDSPVFGIVIGVGAVVIMPVLWAEKRRVGGLANCLPLTVDATESTTCFLMSAALLAGLVANFLWKLWWVDFVAGLIILCFITREAVESFNNVRADRQKSMF